MRQLMAVALALILIGQGTTAWAAWQESTPVEVGLGGGSFFGTVVYTPIKGAFCILGVSAALAPSSLTPGWPARWPTPPVGEPGSSPRTT